MTLSDLCEPLFQEVCRINRMARKGGGADYDLGRTAAEFRTIFEKMKTTANADVSLSSQYHAVEKPLVYFADFMISESKLPWASNWHWMEEEMFGELVGQQAFFELLEETLVDSAPAASDRLEIFYKCIGLGFTGFYVDDPIYLERKMAEISARVKDRMDLDISGALIPENERFVNTAMLDPDKERTRNRLLLMGIGFVGMVIILIVANFMLYRDSKEQLQNDLWSIANPVAKEALNSE